MDPKMKSVIILCCIALAKGHFGYSFGSRGFPFRVGSMGGGGGGFGEMNQGGTAMVPGPASNGFGRGQSASTRRGTVSTAPRNAGKRVKVRPMTTVTGPFGTDNPTPRSGGGNGFGVDYKYAFGGYGPKGWQGIGANPDVVASGTSAAIIARENAASIAVQSRESGQQIGVRSSGKGRPIWTPYGQIGVADSVSSFQGTALGNFPYGGISGGLGEGSDFGSENGSGGDDVITGGIGGYPFSKYFRIHMYIL
ncbi:hypothetical protein CHS0354_035731 [Potamilus streckersoni]|uniref:Uncharacterized protein n=1 Tax=Potamilus streckersoni TaxID=2493646 RepID=A0AAE0VN39_9BIVA|nr:hypothetical protein CHS0354_035731 [Potamilus streckersoni]